jgi:hypothetical protein
MVAPITASEARADLYRLIDQNTIYRELAATGS